MSLNAYSTGKTAKQIVEDCERAARYPNLYQDPNTLDHPVDGLLNNAQAYRWLNDVLKEAYILFDWPGTQTAGTIQILARSQSLPEDFWRMQFENGLWILLDAERFKLTSCGREEFFGSLTDDSTKGRPLRFYIDRNKAGSLFVDPIPDKLYLAEMHYYKLPAKLNSVDDVPDFPYDMFLFWALLERYYMDQDDSRLVVAQQNKMKIVQEVRGVASTNREQSTMSSLDERFFCGMPLEYD